MFHYKTYPSSKAPRERSVGENHLKFLARLLDHHPHVTSDRRRERFVIAAWQNRPFARPGSKGCCFIRHVPRLSWGHSARNTVDWAIVGLGNVPNFRISDREGWTKRANVWVTDGACLKAGCLRLLEGFSKAFSEQGHKNAPKHKATSLWSRA